MTSLIPFFDARNKAAPTPFPTKGSASRMLFFVSCEYENTKKKDLINKQQFADTQRGTLRVKRLVQKNTKQWRQSRLEPRPLDPRSNAKSLSHRAWNHKYNYQSSCRFALSVTRGVLLALLYKTHALVSFRTWSKSILPVKIATKEKLKNLRILTCTWCEFYK